MSLEYIYAVMLLHSIGKEITVPALKKILTAAGFKPNPDRVKSLVSMLKGVNIDEAIKSIQLVKPLEKPAKEPKKEEVAEEKKKEELTPEVEGLGKLFGVN